MRISKEDILQHFEYKDGHLCWKKRSSFASRITVGDKAGNINCTGYVHIIFKGYCYKEHRLIWLMFNNDIPKYLDHINGNRSDNRIENLRPANQNENNQNAKKRKDNTSGVKNVSFDKGRKKWIVRVQINKKTKYLGCYDDLELAALVAEEARNKYHKEFARHE